MRRYGVLGVGAVGGLYGARLAEAGCDVAWILRSDLEAARRGGLKVESPWGDVHLRNLQAWGRPEEAGPCDVVLVAVKTTANAALPGLLKPLVRPGTLVVLMQNGLGAEEELREALPEAQLAAGLCFVCSHKVGPAHVRHLDYGRLMLGHYGGADGVPLLESVAADFRHGGVPVEVNPHGREARWRKLMWNVPFNGLSVVLDSQTDGIMNDPAGRALARALMDEVLAAAQAEGAQVEPAFADRMMADTAKMRPYSPSMKMDYEAARELEIEYLYERPIAAGSRAGVAMPRTEMLARELRFLMNRRKELLKPQNTQKDTEKTR